MKDYIKPVLELEEVIVEDVIAASTFNLFSSWTNDDTEDEGGWIW